MKLFIDITLILLYITRLSVESGDDKMHSPISPKLSQPQVLARAMSHSAKCERIMRAAPRDLLIVITTRFHVRRAMPMQPTSFKHPLDSRGTPVPARSHADSRWRASGASARSPLARASSGQRGILAKTAPASIFDLLGIGVEVRHQHQPAHAADDHKYQRPRRDITRPERLPPREESIFAGAFITTKKRRATGSQAARHVREGAP